MEKAESTERLHCQLQQFYVASSMDEREAEPFISDSDSPQLRLGLLNPSLDNDQLLCIEYVCEFGLGITKELVASAKDDRGRLIFDVLYTVLSQQLDDALSLLPLILKRLDYNTDNGEIKNELSKLPDLNSNEKEEKIYGKYPKLDMWLTLTIVMTSMSEDDYTKLQDHVIHEVLSDSHNTDSIESRCHLLELVNNQPQPDEVNPEPVLDPKDLSTVLKWFEDCRLEYPNEIQKYQQRHEIPVDGPTRPVDGPNKPVDVPTEPPDDISHTRLGVLKICCIVVCLLLFCLSVAVIVAFVIIILLHVSLPDFPRKMYNDTYSKNYTVGVRTTVKINGYYSSSVVKKLQIKALRDTGGHIYANGTVIHRVQKKDFMVASQVLDYMSASYTFTDEFPLFLGYNNSVSPLYNADGLAIVNFSFNLTNNNGADCAVRMATFGSHHDYIKYHDSNPSPREIPLNAYNYTPCLNESGIYTFSLNMKRDAFSFFVISHIINVSLTVDISGHISEYLIHDQESSCILSPSCHSDIIISDEECTSNDDDSADDERWYVFGTSSSSFQGEVNLTVYPLCDKEYNNLYFVAVAVAGFVILLLLAVTCIVCLYKCISKNKNEPYNCVGQDLTV